MIRTSRPKSAVVFVAGLALAGTLFVGPPAAGNDSGSNRDIAERFRRPGAPLDPVLSALAAGHLVRQVSALEDGVAAVAEVTRGFALTGLDLAAVDVTGTEVGRHEATAFVNGLSRRGIDAGATRFTVYALPSIKEANDAVAGRHAAPEDGDGGPLASSLVVPEGTVVELVGAVFEGGQLHAKTVLSASAEPPSSTGPRHLFSGTASPGDSATFARAGGIGCFHRQQNNTAWYDPCQEFWQHQNDNDADRDYWAAPMWGTGKSKSVWVLSGLEAASRRKDGTAHQDWVGWDPGADGKQNCTSQTVSVSYAGASVSVDKQHCELWDISKGEHPAQFSNWWRGDVRRSERETAAAVLTSTKGGEVPTDNFDFDFFAHP